MTIYDQSNDLQNEAGSGDRGFSAAADESDKTVSLSNEPDPVREERPVQVNIIALGLRTAFMTVAVVVLLFGCFVSFFPYTAMRMYSALDLKYMALVNAERYMSRNADEVDIDNNVFPAPFGKYADALYCAVNNSVYFMDDAASSDGYNSESAGYYAKKADEYITRYLMCNNAIDSLFERTVKIDEYSLKNSLPALRPYVYSFTDKLEIARFKSWLITGEESRLVRRAQEATTLWNQEGWSVTAERADDYFLFLAQLSAYIDSEIEALGYKALAESRPDGMLTSDIIPDDGKLYGVGKPFDLFVYDGNDYDNAGNRVGDGKFKELYNTVTAHYTDFVDYIKANATKHNIFGDRDHNEHLKITYYLKSLSDFAYSMNNMTAVLQAHNLYFDSEFRDDIRNASYKWEANLQVYNVRIHSGDTFVSSGDMKDWYRDGLLYDYLDFFRAHA